MSRNKLIGVLACLLGLAVLAFVAASDPDSVCINMVDYGLRAQMSKTDIEHCEALRAAPGK